MTDLMAMAPVLTFSALALGCAIAIRAMLKEMSVMFQQLAGTDAEVREVRRAKRTVVRINNADIVELPRRRREAAVSVKAGAPLPVAA